MKAKILNILLLVSSLFGYLEWGTDNQSYLFEAEIDIISQFFKNPLAVLHPFVLLPLFAQIILLFTLFQRQPNRILTYIGIAGLALLFVFMFLIGILSQNFKILLSTIPFLSIAIFTFLYHRKSKTNLV